MKFKLVLHVFTLLSLALVRSHARSPQVMYLKSVLPDTTMPKVISDLISYTKAWGDGKEKIYDAFKDEVKDNSSLWYDPSNDEVLKAFAWFQYAAFKGEVKDNPMAQMFLLEKDLHLGNEMKLHILVNSQKTPFLPKNISDSIPFSSKYIPEIYSKFSVKSNSMEAKVINETLSLCESKGFEGEEKLCVTSLESMVDFTTTHLGKKAKALPTDVYAKESTRSQKYKIESAKKLTTNKAVVCHLVNYAYDVFGCHTISKTRSYVVSMVGEDGTKVKSNIVCHIDTSKWNPNNLAFQMLKVTPGTVPVCHFAYKDMVVWVPYE